MLHQLAAALVAATTLAATPGKVQWQADYGKALEATRNVQRPLLVVLDVPANPDSSLNSELLAPEGEQAHLLAKYELCHVDASTEYGKKVAAAFHATQFPHTAIIDKTGKTMIYQKPGQMAPEQWKTTLASYQSGEAPVASTSFYRGGSVMSYGGEFMSSPSSQPYCPSCQRKAMGF